MINEYEASEILIQEFPRRKDHIVKLSQPSYIYTIMICFFDLTRTLIEKDDFIKTKKCFNTAEKMLMDGNYKVKSAVGEIYIYSVGSIIESFQIKTNPVSVMFSSRLRNEYKKQVISHEM